MPALPSPQELDDLSDRLNPVFVRELRRSFKSPWLTGWFFLMLAVFALGSMVWLLRFSHPLELENQATRYFLLCFQTLAFGCCLPIPLIAYQMGRDESGEEILEMLVAAGLSNRQIFFGKVHAGMVQVVLHCSALMPFLTIAFMMGRLDPLVMLLLVLINLGASYGLCALAVGTGFLPIHSAIALLSQVLVSLAILGGLGLTAILLVRSAHPWWGLLLVGLPFALGILPWSGIAVGYGWTSNRLIRFRRRPDLRHSPWRRKPAKLPVPQEIEDGDWL